MAYVGCIAGAISIENYWRMLVDAGFAHVEVIDSGRDLNAYAKVENQAACCPPACPACGLVVVDSACCTPGPAAAVDEDEALHVRLADLLKRYDPNEYAASVNAFAIKPQ
jgi:hypothetical protein